MQNYTLNSFFFFFKIFYKTFLECTVFRTLYNFSCSFMSIVFLFTPQYLTLINFHQCNYLKIYLKLTVSKHLITKIFYILKLSTSNLTELINPEILRAKVNSKFLITLLRILYKIYK